MMRLPLDRALLLLALAIPAYGQTTVVLVRHADKEKDPAILKSFPPDNGPLSSAGRDRAEALAGLLRDADVRAVYATDYLRTQQTAKPLADALSLKVLPLTTEVVEGQRSRNDGRVVVIVAHSGDRLGVPKFVDQITGSPQLIEIDDDVEFDRIFTMTRSADGSWRVRQAVYGEATPPRGGRTGPGPLPGREVFDRHAVVAQEGLAADIGRQAMRDGGNAVDAAVATAFALAVTHPAAGNLGGGGFLVVSLADAGGKVTTVDFREAAPAASTERMYLGPDGKPLPKHRAGARAAGVPGTVRGLGLAHSRYGKRPWAELVKPATKLAREGFAVSETLARSLNGQLNLRDARPGVAEDLGDDPDRLADFPESVRAFAKADRTPWKEGEILKQPDLAATLDRIAAGGPDEFYTGKTADLIAAYSASHGGITTKADLQAYKAVERRPTHTTYRGHDIYGMGPPASGGIVVAQALNILERFDLKADGPTHPRTHHRVAEALRRGFYTRATAVADPDMVSIDVAGLTSKPHADGLAASITDRATPSAALAPFPIQPPEGSDTTHLSTIDGAGNAVALTYTLEEGYGSKATVEGAGFLLNNEMGDFNLVPGRTDAGGRIGTTPNLIAPGKRMLSSQSPTIALKGGKVRLVTGSPGGRTIPSTTLWVVLSTLEFGLSPREAVDAPRTHHPWFPDVLSVEAKGSSPELLAALQAMGHAARTVGLQGDAHTIVVDEAGRRHGVADRRRATSRASGD